jgi:hypothetical protein
MRAKEFLSELFNQTYPLSWHGNGGYIRALFDANGKEGEVKFYHEAGFWTIDFFIDGRHDITGLGDELTILGTVGHAIKEFVHKYDPNRIAFSAKEPSRAKLYKRMIPRLFPNYEHDHELSQQTGFGLKKHGFDPNPVHEPFEFPG